MAANTMNIDPFSTNSTELDKSTKPHPFSSSLIGFYLCSFDTTYGLQILFSIPATLRKNADEHNILKTHYIWKIEHIPMRIDLKISEFIYSAFQLHELQSQNVADAVEKPIFGIVLKIWKDGEFIQPEALSQFREELITHHWKDIELLYTRQILKLNPTKRRKYLQYSEKAAEIRESLQEAWENFGSKIKESRIFFSSQNLTLTKPSVHSSYKKPQEKSYFKESVTMRILNAGESTEEVLVILVNQMETLEEVKIKVSKKTEFFSENLWDQDLEEWPTKEDLILEFPRSSILESYMLKISSKGQTVAIKSFDIDPT